MEPKELHHNLTSIGTKFGKGKVGVTLDTRKYDPNADLFNDISEINIIINWSKNEPQQRV